MDYKERIETNPNVLSGKPIVKGTRISVELILKKLSEGITIDELLEIYPNLTKDDVLAVLSYSAYIISQEELVAP